MNYSRNKVGTLKIWLCCIDDNLIVGPFHVIKLKAKIRKKIKIDDVGKLKEFIEYKIEI